MSDVSAPTIDLTLGYSPDADDVAMWWPIVAKGANPSVLDTGRFRFHAVTEDIESLNRRSMTGELDVTAMSCAQLAFVAETYAITTCGCSMGDGFGPKLVAKAGVTLETIQGRSGAMVAVPGERTTAFAALTVLLGPEGFDWVEAPFDAILGMVERDEVTAGLLIHETQLSFQQHGVEAMADLAQLWAKRFGLPLPLGINTIRKDLDERFGEGTVGAVTRMLRDSIAHSMRTRAQSFAIARKASGGVLNDQQLEAYLSRYVNAWTLDLGAVGKLAVERLLGEASRIGLAPMPSTIDFAEPAMQR